MKTTKKEINGIMFEFVNEKREAREYKTLEQAYKTASDAKRNAYKMFSATSVLFLHRRHLQMPYRRSGRSCPAQNPYAAYNTRRNHAVHKGRPDLLSSGRSYRFPVEAAPGLPAYPAHPEVQPVIPHIHKYPHNNEPNGGQAFSELQHLRRTWTYDLRYTLPSQVPARKDHQFQ